MGLGITAHLKSIIFRREYRQLRDVIERSRQLLSGTGARFNGTDGIWREIPGGRTLEFGAVQYEPDVERYQGRAHDLKGFDELTHFTLSQYQYLIGWNRTTVVGQRARVVATGNPPMSAEGEWVIRRWGAWLDSQHPHPAAPGELRWYAVVDGEEVEVETGEPFEFEGELITPKSRTFIPARLADNPYLMATDYGATLQAMPEPMRSKMLYGDFAVGFEDDPYQVIPTEWVLRAQERWEHVRRDTPLTALGVDVARGGGDQTVLSRRYDNWFDELEKHPGSSTPDGGRVAQLVIAALAGHPNVRPVVDVIGIGASVYDTLVSHGVPAVGLNVSEASEARDKSSRLGFVNKRAELYWKLREALDPESGEDIALPPDRELRADLCAPKWKLMARGIQIESKEDIIKRIGRSPDCADAVVLALYHGGYGGRLPRQTRKPALAGLRKKVF